MDAGSEKEEDAGGEEYNAGCMTLVVRRWRPWRAPEKDAGARGRRMEYNAGTKEEEY